MNTLMRKLGRMHGWSALASGLASAWLLFGCTGLPPTFPPESFGEAKAHHQIVVPFFPDNTDQCGPSTLASVLTYWGVRTDPVTLKEKIYMPRLRGSLPIDLFLAAQEYGLQVESYQGSLDNIRTELEAGHPLVAFLNLGFGPFTQGHYIVITGYDDERQGVYAHSGLDRDDFLSYELFLPDWEKTGRWTLRIVPQENRGRTRA